ncbi:translation initiation factor IF-3 [Holospora obtusa F1]|uniref:Translation initiation factor IF-3 n=2 Tax=Holospora obtusa F1 TaxID=1399147 RepID=W6TF46_HOLOB|nr:translation initiation factor IF-3 [Holospora obtusa]ETZ07594.1 translation initiation factor IF-3 [Holospora obtusa F1]
MEVKSQKSLKCNQEIRASRVRLISTEGQQLGIFSFRDALDMARKQNLDLVEIASTAEPPVCKICDYGRMIYQEKKRKAELQKKQQRVSIKEIQLTQKTQENDYKVKLKRAIEFLQEGDKVQLVVQIKGRCQFSDDPLKDPGRLMADRFILDISGQGKIEQGAKKEGRRIRVVIAPLKDHKKVLSLDENLEV